MDEKTIQRIKKMQALAERGVGGEKTTAQKKLAKLLKDNGIHTQNEGIINAVKNSANIRFLAIVAYMLNSDYL